MTLMGLVVLSGVLGTLDGFIVRSCLRHLGMRTAVVLYSLHIGSVPSLTDYYQMFLFS